MDRQIKELVAAARQWARARATARRTADSKKASEKDMDKAKSKLMECSERLFQAVVGFEKALATAPQDGKKRQIPWNKVFGAIALGAQAIESAVQTKDLSGARFIDTFGEEV